MRPKTFMKRIDREAIVGAIRAAEAGTRGEIRVHVAGRPALDHQKAAARMFEKLGMAATAERNGVLIFIDPASRGFAVIGDVAIHRLCGPGFWRDIAAAMEEDFRAGRFTEGIIKGISRAGRALAANFPPLPGRADANELPDRVSEG